MVIPLIICGLLLFAIVFAGIHQLQRHQLRWTRNSLEQRQAYFLADAAMTRGLARFVAQPYVDRWYGESAADDLLPDRKHSGLMDQSSAAADDGAGAPAVAGSYTLLVEDRHAGELQGMPLTTGTNLDFTELFAHATVDGHDGPVHALVYTRVAICPEVGYLDPDPAGAERFKKVLRYRVYTAPEIADKPYTTPGGDTAAVRSRFQWEMARAHQNHLRNRLTFRDLRAKVDEAWGKPAPGPKTYTDAEVEALFADIAPISQNAHESTDPPASNWFLADTFRTFRLSDLPLSPPEGMRFLVDPASLYDARKEQIAANVMLLFSGNRLQPLPDWTRPGSVNPFDSGDEFIDRVIRNGKTAEDMIADPTEDWAHEVANCWRDEQQARIVPGHIFPYPTPTGPFSDPELGMKYEDSVFLDAFASSTPPTIAEMEAEVLRINPLLPPEERHDPKEVVKDLGIRQVAYAVLLETRLIDETGALSQAAVSVRELITYFAKYIEAPQAPFVADGPPNPGPAIPPDDPDPPKEGPDVLPPAPPPPPPKPRGFVSGKVVP